MATIQQPTMTPILASDFPRFITSEIFQLIAQNRELRFLVHKDILISQSEPLGNAAASDFIDIPGRMIDLGDWDGDTVGRLVEFLYTGDYQYPDPNSISAWAQIEPERPSQCQIIGHAVRPDDGVNLCSTRPLTPLSQCLDNILPSERGDQESDVTRLERFNTEDGYMEVLLVHSKLYCLAHDKSVHGLQTLSLRRLYMVLLKLNPLQSGSRTALDFISLAKYVYEHTASPTPTDTEEPLRRLISYFTAQNIQVLQDMEEMAELMDDGGDFVNDLMPKLCRRLTVTEKDLAAEREKILPPPPSPPPPPPPRRQGPNPVIKYFNTGEVHHPSDPWKQTSKVIFFGKTYPSPPGLPVGLNTLDFGKHCNIRVNAYTSNVGTDRFRIHMDTWDNTNLYSAGCAWLEIPKNDPDFQYGRFCTLEVHQHPQTRTARVITFPRAYKEPPLVVVWLTGLDMQHDKFWRVKTYTTKIHSTSFTLHIDTWDDSILHSATASWVAYPSDTPNVYSGCFNTSDIRPLHPPQVRTSGHVNFSPGVFTTSPHALLAFSSLDINCCENLRIRADYSHMTTAGMNWHISGVENTVIYSAGVSYIALA